MLDDLSEVEKSIEDILIDLMIEKVMSTGVQASSTRGVQASPSTSHGSGPSRVATEKQTKNRDELVNVKLIPSILPDYIPPLDGVVSCDSVPRDFNYTFITAYLPKGIHTFGLQLEQIITLNINDFNLGDHKNHRILTPHKYLTKNKGKNSIIIPQFWTMDIARPTILNVMKIPHFGRHQEVNMYAKILLSCFHGSYLWLDRCITIDPTLIHRITRLRMQGIDPQEFYPGKAVDRTMVQKINGDVEKGKRGYKVDSIQNGTVCLSHQLIIGNLVRKNRPMQVTGFIVYLTRKCVEGIQMN
jgi:hypothetical protein